MGEIDMKDTYFNVKINPKHKKKKFGELVHTRQGSSLQFSHSSHSFFSKDYAGSRDTLTTRSS